MKTLKQNTLKNYTYEITITDGLYITLDKGDIEKNCSNLEGFTCDVMESEYLKYGMVMFHKGSVTIIVLVGDYGNSISQFLITSNEIMDNIKIEDLIEYVDYEIADIVVDYYM